MDYLVSTGHLFQMSVASYTDYRVFPQNIVILFYEDCGYYSHLQRKREYWSDD